jgi:hypothetical protein
MGGTRPEGSIILEAKMGFKTRLGLTRDHKKVKVPEISRFLTGVGDLDTGIDDCRTAKQIGGSKVFDINAQALFQEFGPIYWSDIAPSWAWSFEPSQRLYYNRLAREYLKQLQFSNSGDKAM